jgi:hypothetical protein
MGPVQPIVATTQTRSFGLASSPSDPAGTTVGGAKAEKGEPCGLVRWAGQALTSA